jgi:hypothetical protein
MARNKNLIREGEELSEIKVPLRRKEVTTTSLPNTPI